MKTQKAIGIFTSGGDAPGMNACIRALVRSCEHYGYTCIGFKEGYEGMMDGNYVELHREDVNNIIHLGGTMLGSSRSERFRSVESNTGQKVFGHKTPDIESRLQ